MINIQNDQKVIEQGREKPLKIEDQTRLQDKSVQKLVDRLNEDHIGSVISDNWIRESSLLSEYLKRQLTQLDQLDNFNTATGESNPFGGVSALHVPMPFTVCKTYHARFVEALMGIDPPFSVKPRREDSTDAVQQVEDLMRFALTSWANRGQGIEPTVDTWIWNWCTTGTGIIKNRWLVEYERYTTTETKYIASKPTLIDLPDGSKVEVPQWTYEEKEVEKVERTQYCPQYDIVNNEDIVIIRGEGDPDAADLVIQRMYLQATDLWLGVDRGIYREDIVEKIIESGRSNPMAPQDQGSQIKLLRKTIAGHTDFGSSGNDVYEILEACLKYDVDGNGIGTEIVVWVDRKTNLILKATYLRRISKNGKRPYAVAHFHRRPGEPFGVGLMEMLVPLSKELDLMHNTRIDNVFLESTPFYIYRKTAGFDPDNIVIEPGAGIGVNDIGDIVFPQLPQRTQFSMSEESVIGNYVERLTGISELSLGIPSSTQGVARTATGAQALMGENNTNLSIHLRRLNQGFSKLLQNTWFMLRDKVEPGFAFRVVGSDGKDVFHQVQDVMMGIDVDFEVSANSSNSNKSIQVQTAQTLMQITQNPLLIQSGISDPAKIYAALKLYIQALGTKDVHRYVNCPQGYEYLPSPQEEFQRIIIGKDSPVVPQMDHASYIAFLSKILELQAGTDPSGQLKPDQITAITNQLKKHQEMQQALQQQQAQQANQGQMRTNMAMAQGTPVPTFNDAGGPYGKVF